MHQDFLTLSLVTVLSIKDVSLPWSGDVKFLITLLYLTTSLFYMWWDGVFRVSGTAFKIGVALGCTSPTPTTHTGLQRLGTS